MTTKTIADASKQLEAVMLRQMLREAHVFGGSEGGGSHVYADMFVDAVADAITKAGGLGLAGSVQRSLQPPPRDHVPPPVPSNAGLEEALLVGRGHVSSGFGERTDPIDGHASFHSGIDVAAPRGTPIRALAGGVVRKAGENGGYGLSVEIEHPDGLVTRYAHAERLHVQVGQKVGPGDIVADVGTTGRSTGPHVHIEARIRGHAIDPHTILQAPLQIRQDGADERSKDPKP